MNTNPFPDRSPCFTSHDLPCIPSPNTWRALSSLLCCPPSVTGFPISTYRLSGLDFTLNPQARRYARPNRVPHRTDCMFASGCSPPHLAVTQLPSATGTGHLPGGDLHPSDRACSQAHGFRPEACRNDEGAASIAIGLIRGVQRQVTSSSRASCLPVFSSGESRCHRVSGVLRSPQDDSPLP